MRPIKSWHHYVDSMDVLRVAIRYDDDLEEDRPATSLEALLLRPGEELIRDAERWREHQKVMREATKPDALHIRLTMHEGGKVWGSQYVLDTRKFGRDTVLGIRAVGLSTEAQATKLFKAMAAYKPLPQPGSPSEEK